MADYESERQRIISSVFTKLNATGHDEQYVAHVKIWEEASQEEGGRKPRYILLSMANNGSGFIHKSKLNSNGLFSVGKTWKITELRGIEVTSPTSFNVTMARTYRWQTEDPRNQTSFVASLIQLFHTVTSGSAPLQLKGVRVPDAPSSSRPPALDFTTTTGRRMDRAPTPTNGAPLPPASPRRPVMKEPHETHQHKHSEQFDEFPLPKPHALGSTRQRAGTLTRTDSSDTTASRTATVAPDRSGTPSRGRPSTPSSQPAIPLALRPGHTRRVSNVSQINGTSSTVISPTTSTPPRVVLQTPPTNASQPLPRVTPQPPPVSITTRLNGAGANLEVPSTSPINRHSPLSTYSSVPEPVQLLVPTPRQPLSARRSPSRAPTMEPGESGQPRREQNARISFYDPTNQATINRLLSGDVIIHDDVDGEGEDTATQEDENALDTLESMEEMLEDSEWGNDDILGRRSVTGAADRMEARLLDELTALEKANIYSFIESDDRVNVVLKYIDEAIMELEGMDSVLSSYKIHLNAVSDDIAYIQSQNRGLQVQIQNQHALMAELEELLQTVHVEEETLLTLTQESLEKPASIQRIEGAATELYKALQAGRDRDMAATMERLDEYRTHNAHFCKRILDFLSIMFTAQSKILLGDNDGVIKSPQGKPSLADHKVLENYLGRYSGLILYLKEMEESIYGKLCAAYFSVASTLHGTQVRALMIICGNMIKKVTEDDSEGFGGATPTAASSKAASGMRRAGTIVRSPLEGRKERKERSDGDSTASEAFGLVLEQLARAVYHEEEFIADFLQINDAGLTFADYMGLENYFRRQASRAAGLSSATMKLVRGAMDLIFGFIATELKGWLDNALAKDQLHIVGIIATLERFLGDAEEHGNAFLQNMLEKQHGRLKGLWERRVDEHIKSIEDTKLTSKKRNGVAPFIKYFPVYVGRVETQLVGADTLEVRHTVDQSYGKVVQSMFGALKHMAKMEGEGEDKGQLNYHVILIENMHYFVAEISQLQIGSIVNFLKSAEGIYEENLNAYVRIVLRRPFYKIIEYFEGVERLLKTTAPTEVSSNGAYSKAALKKVVKEYNAKDVRKHVDTLFKRVEKHFTEASEKATTEDVSTGIASGTVMVGVWKACEEELLRITELFAKRINQCYKDTGIALEYSAADVEAAFKRHRVAA
ncbi:uncharacterized protein LAESUDRAFT_730167 [Laetiporus sulphureus 93-53]|uniref:Exocyst complex component Sec3 PIP2-binding N-terminal domain-containing protein n=1 Tax=Laetiporus sulphureus 93-53 TaxID=1314785 RepID=A0A165C983_9APHY|nr:uncharacterized protein LAESUDRAFT_730167 [Laetiporus sulphureus 93-53]KZT02419.1 hypothetical protein LAESUDRAFT_730167 [Laetiporus sulphureus 93-53]